MKKQTTQDLKEEQAKLAREGKRDSQKFKLVTELLHLHLAEEQETEAGEKSKVRPSPFWHFIANIESE